MKENNIDNDYSLFRLGDTLWAGNKMFIFLSSSPDSEKITLMRVGMNKTFEMIYNFLTQTYQGDGYFLHAHLETPHRATPPYIMVNTIKAEEPYLYKII